MKSDEFSGKMLDDHIGSEGDGSEGGGSGDGGLDENPLG